MKKVLSFILILLVVTSCRYLGIRGNGNIESEKREVSEFNQIDVSGAFDVDIEIGDETVVEIITDENLFKHIITKVRGSKLILDTDKNLSPSDELQVKIITAGLNHIAASGAVSIKAENLNTSKLLIDLSGATDVKLQGETGVLKVDMSGASNCKAKNLIAKKVYIDGSGASNAVVFANEFLSIDISGAGNVDYYGNPSEIKTDISGAASINKKK